MWVARWVAAVASLSEVTMNVRPVHTEADHRAALADISVLMASDPAPGTPKGDRLDILATLVQSLGIPAEVLIAENPLQR